MSFASVWRSIEARELQILDEKSAFLRSCGWKATSQTIGSRWMWEKLIDGRVYLVGTDSAGEIQNSLDAAAWFKLHPEDERD